MVQLKQGKFSAAFHLLSAAFHLLWVNALFIVFLNLRYTRFGKRRLSPHLSLFILCEGTNKPTLLKVDILHYEGLINQLKEIDKSVTDSLL